MEVERMNPVDVEVVSNEDLQKEHLERLGKQEELIRQLRQENVKLQEDNTLLKKMFDDEADIIAKLKHTVETLRHAQIMSDASAAEQRKKSDDLFTKLTIERRSNQNEIDRLNELVQELQAKLEDYTIAPVIRKVPKIPDVSIPTKYKTIPPCSKDELLFVGYYLNFIRCKSGISIEQVSRETGLSANVIRGNEIDTKSKISIKHLAWCIKHQDYVSIPKCLDDVNTVCEWLLYLQKYIPSTEVAHDTGISVTLIDKALVPAGQKQIHTKLLCWYLKQNEIGD